MNARILVAGVLAGLVIFVWGAISHMALPLGEMGVSELPAQETVLSVLGENVKERKIYLFPWYEDPAEQEKAWANYPHGILALSPSGGAFSFPRALAVEGVTDILGGVLAAFLFAAAAPALAGVGKQIAFGATLGAFASLAIDFSYWNWYGFPTEYLLAQLIGSIVGWSLAALVLGWRLGCLQS